MCGRYNRTSDKQRIAQSFRVHAGLEELEIVPNEDISPQSIEPVIHTSDDGELQIELMRWAFKLPDRLLFNARSEGIERANFWKNSFAKRRCIIPADSFFEWKRESKSKKPKYEFTIADRSPFGMAGLWNLWKNPKTDEWERTFAILTGPPNERMQPIHDRMPIILDPRDYADYLRESERPPTHLLRILPAETMRSLLLEESVLSNRQVGLFDSQ